MRDIFSLILTFVLLFSCNKQLSKEEILLQNVVGNIDCGGNQQSLLIYKDKGKQGLIDTLGNIVLSPKYDYIENWSQFGVIMIDSGGVDKSELDYIHYEMNKIGLIDCQGVVLFEPQFDELIFSSSPIALVKKNNKYGYINNKGDFVIPMIYDSAGVFIENFAVVKTPLGCGLINKKGAFIIKPEHQEIMYGYASGYSKDTLMLFIDKHISKLITNNGNLLNPIVN